MPTRRLAVGLTPMETRREVVLHVADRAQELGYDAFFLAEGWGHDAGDPAARRWRRAFTTSRSPRPSSVSVR